MSSRVMTVAKSTISKYRVPHHSQFGPRDVTSYQQTKQKHPGATPDSEDSSGDAARAAAPQNRHGINGRECRSGLQQPRRFERLPKQFPVHANQDERTRGGDDQLT